MAGRHVEAENAFRRALALRPGVRDAQINLGMSLMYQGRHREAIPVFLEARVPGDRSLNDVLIYGVLSALQDEVGDRTEPALDPGPLGRDPLVSVIIPTRERPAMLRDALASVERQSYAAWEVVVVSDGGGRPSIPKHLAGRVTAIELASRQGVARARNTALDAARGEVFAFLDDDDLFLPEHLATLVEGLRASGMGFACTRSVGVEERIEGDARVELRRGAAYEYRYSRAQLLVRNLVPTANWGMRRACFERLGGFDEALACAEDWDMLLRVSAVAGLHSIPAVTAEMRVRPGVADSVTRRVPLRPTCELLYRRYPSGGQPLIDLGRSLYLESLG